MTLQQIALRTIWCSIKRPKVVPKAEEVVNGDQPSCLVPRKELSIVIQLSRLLSMSLGDYD